MKEWTQDENNEYIGRAGIVFIDNERFPKKASIWSNPFKLRKNATQSDKDECLQMYKEFITKRLDNNIEMQYKLVGLENKRLGCWCVTGSPDDQCHGQVLQELIPIYKEQLQNYENDVCNDNNI